VGRWAPGLSGGLATGSTGHENPQFLLTVTAPTSLFITLTQEQVKGEPYEHIMCIMVADAAGGEARPRQVPVSAVEVAAETTAHTGAPRNQREVRATRRLRQRLCRRGGSGCIITCAASTASCAYDLGCVLMLQNYIAAVLARVC
jgi:hypothetical protein